MPGCVALDRDGTVLVHVPYLKQVGDVRLLPGVGRAIRRLNRSGIPVIIVTNQSVIGRQELTWPELDDIHRRMLDLLWEDGAHIDDILVCPHVPEDGCSCRKPALGLLQQAALRARTPIDSCAVIGDSEGDIAMGIAGGARVVHVRTGVHRKLTKGTRAPSVKDLAAAVDFLLGGHRG